jgi:hypothetical protein
MKAFPTHREEGMTLRDYFAAKAMQEFISEMPLVWTENTISTINIATKMAYRVADAMMKAREE